MWDIIPFLFPFDKFFSLLSELGPVLHTLRQEIFAWNRKKFKTCSVSLDTLVYWL